MTKRAVIVGAGLAGSILAARLREHYAVTVIDLLERPAPFPTPIVETGTPLRLEIHAGAGPGGSTNFWHNGLIEIEDDDYRDWPLTKPELVPYIAQSLNLLGGADHDALAGEDRIMRQRLLERGVPKTILGTSIFYPKRRRNMWSHCGLGQKSVNRMTGTARYFQISDSGTAEAVWIDTTEGPQRIAGDLFICSAGGLSAPVLMAESARRAGLDLPAIGRFYHDHPMSWVGQMTLDLKIYDAWNHSTKSVRGALRIPFITRVKDTKFAFYVRTQALNRHRLARSALSDLRNNLGNLRNYLRVLGNTSDVLEVLAFQFGINIPSSTYSILMVAEQAPDQSLSLSAHPDGGIARNWTLPPTFAADAQEALMKMVGAFGKHVVDFNIQDGWENEIHTAAHHSGGCRMSGTADRGVCDRELKVFGLDNLFICDGSILPPCGYANTGLTIGALSLRLADRLLNQAGS